MAAEICSAHAGVAAAFRCDGCGELLCRDCVQQSHALFLCRRCGEMAVPVEAGAPTSFREIARRERVAKPYPLSAAFAYAFRGTGLYLFLATLVCMAVVEFIVTFGFGCLPILIALAFWSLMVGIQFKIVGTTADGEDELPDWPDYLSVGERIPDILAYLFLALLQVAPPALYVYTLGLAPLLTTEPSYFYWLGFVALAWLGGAFAVVGLAAAGRFGPGAALRLDRHVRAFAAAPRDALVIVNLVFVLGVAFFVVRSLFELVPLLGAAVSGVLGAYWIFTGAHLAGLLVRRNGAVFETLYD